MTAGEAASDTLAGVQLTAERTEDGFRLAHGDGNGFYMAQTLISPPIEGTSYAVHIVRTNGDNQEFNFRKDAVVVNPDKADFHIYPLFSAWLDVDYGADSIAEAYGFLDDRHLLYVSAVNDASREEGYFYRVEKLNIITGETTVLFPEIPDVVLTDHFAPGWLNEDKNTLVLNGYGSGRLWSFDLINREINIPKSSFSHSWPIYLTVHSPDGERFWYTDYERDEYRLHDKIGNLLSKTSFGLGLHEYPAFQWSPDSRYSVNQDTLDQDMEQILNDDGEVDIIAPQRLRFYDRQGKWLHTVQISQGSGKSIEVAGWLDDSNGAVLLHEYELDRILASEEPAKVNSSYRLLSLKSGKMQDLIIEPDLTKLKDAIPALTSQYFYGSKRGIYLIDTKRMRLAILSEDGGWVPDLGKDRIMWVTNDYEAGKSAFHEFNQITGQLDEKTFDAVIGDIRPVGTDWLVWGDFNYMRVE